MATIGTDPEFFVRDAENQIIPVVGLLGGTKGEPIPLAGLPEGFGAQEDNVMAELTVPAAMSAEAFTENVKRGAEVIGDMLGEHDCALDMSTCEYRFSGEAIGRHSQALQFGCSPDFNAYEKGRQRPTIDPALVGNNRFCGGHVHFGGDFRSPPFIGAMFADAVLGLWSVGRDPQRTRRQYYGAAGTYRPTAYGFEYRVLSNFWTYDSDTAWSVGQNALTLATFLERDAREVRRAMLSMNWGDVRALVSMREPSSADSRLAGRLHRQFMEVIS